MDLSEVGRKVRAGRKAKRLTQAQLAGMTGVSRATVNSLEKGTIRELGFRKVNAILKAFGQELSPVKAANGTEQGRKFLRRMARRYIWWQPPGESVRDPRRVVAQVMDLGTLEDIRMLAGTVGKRELIEVLGHARPGWFHPKSWAFWHTALWGSAPGDIPPMPTRRSRDLPDPA